MQKVLEEKFDKLFGKDEDELKVKEKVLHSDPHLLLTFLKEWVMIIRKHPFDLLTFIAFKSDILDYGVEEYIVTFSEKSISSAPYVMFDLKWENINSIKNIFVAIMMLENSSHILPSHPNKNFWDIID